jgi:hypothetical protein
MELIRDANLVKLAMLFQQRSRARSLGGTVRATILGAEEAREIETTNHREVLAKMWN